jgi:hypothetical protein
VLLAPLGCGDRVPTGIREYVTERFPTVTVDWAAMADGPRYEGPITEEQLNYLEVENRLRDWADSVKSYPGESRLLLAAANLLSSWRSRRRTI